MKFNFLYTQLVERKAELALELARTELEGHSQYSYGHSRHDPDYGVVGETVAQRRDRLQAEYDSVCSRIDQLKEEMRRQNYELRPLDQELSTVFG